MKISWLILIVLLSVGTFAMQPMDKCPVRFDRPPKIKVTKPCADLPTDCKTNPQKLKQRTMDGTCNNLDNPRWGAGYYRYTRLVQNNYADSIYEMPRSKRNCALPNPRRLSNEVFKEANVKDPKLTLAHMQFGQYIAHDTGFQLDKIDPLYYCCTANGSWTYCDPNEKVCASIRIYQRDCPDPVFPSTIRCMNFVRSVTDYDLYCKGYISGRQHQPQEQINAATAYLDHSPTYGANLDENKIVRKYEKGLLKTKTICNLPFPALQEGETTCSFAKDPCFQFTDFRGNTNPGLFTVHTIFYNEHNYIAAELLKVNPSWNDEKLFQMARKINIAILQRITYDEYIKNVLDEKTLKEKRIVKEPPCDDSPFVNDYDPLKNPGTYNEFATAAYRYFHTEIEGSLKLYNNLRNIESSMRLSDCMSRPACLLESNCKVFTQMAIGLVTQAQQAADINFDPEIKHYGFRGAEPYGMDLRAIDIIRARDHGLATYQSLRDFCGLPLVKDWKDLENYIPKDVVKSLQKHYECVDDLDLAVAGALEKKVPGSLVGETFSCIIAHQYNFMREGDRFFYENSDNLGGCGFTPEQLAEVKKVTIAKVFCNQVPGLLKVQKRAFEQVSTDNQYEDCTALPYIDFTKFKDAPC